MAPIDESRGPGWTADDSTFGARLALIRQRMQWGNVKEAAVACGLPPESWRTWERDGVTPRKVVEIAAVISDRTGCDYGWLLAGSRLKNRPDAGKDINTATTRYLNDAVRTTMTSRTADTHIVPPPKRRTRATLSTVRGNATLSTRRPAIVPRPVRA